MNCPICKTSDLIDNNLEANLSSLKCSTCEGNWIPGAAYWRWLEAHGENLPEIKTEKDDLPVSDIQDPKPCPECKWVMTKYRVGHGTGFSLDQCARCKGIWFDTNEWEVLRRRNLHDDINAVFTSFWQAEAAKEEKKRKLEQIYVHKFGEDDYAEIKRIRAWLDGHSRKHELLAYLTDVNPLGS